MSAYDSDPRVMRNADGTVTADNEVVFRDEVDGWCATRSGRRTSAGFKSRDILLGQILGPAQVAA